MPRLLPLLLLLAACSPVVRPAALAAAPDVAAAPADTVRTPCSNCTAWNRPRAPFKVFGGTYYVGTAGLGAVLVTSPEGHILIDGALGESAPLIAANVAALGFRMADVKLILNTHAHFDHAGGLAALQQMSGAAVAASAPSAAVLRAGVPGRDDPQYTELAPLPFAPVPRVRVLTEGETVRVGGLALTAHATPGHTRGGTTWTWAACEGALCHTIVYADSISPVSDDAFRFRGDARYPGIVQDFERTFATLEALPCDILVTPHPEASGLFERVAARDAGAPGALVDAAACTRYAATGRERLARRLATEG